MSVSSGPPVRLVVRQSLEFMIATLPPLVRWQGDLVRGVIFLAIAQSNRPRFSELARHGLAPWLASDNALKPVSVLALSESLGLAYETTRRHVVALEKAGLGRRDGQGVLVPNAVMAGAEFAAFADGTFTRFVGMLRSLSTVGFDLRSFARGPVHPPEDNEIGAPDLGVRHVVIDFVLRLVECGIFAHDADMVRAFIFSAIMAANADPYTEDAAAAWDFATLAQSPPEERRRPVTVLEISKRTGIPYETTRRYVQQMLYDKDIVKSKGKGFINPQVSPRDAKLHESGAMVLSRFAQVLGDLRRLGLSFETWRIEPQRNVA
ncbi:MAG: hypothetical protein JSR60_14940 [Proteobacteria bacterium]|nr:hypothetical protein [Pseudomonadota bacterium]